MLQRWLARRIAVATATLLFAVPLSGWAAGKHGKYDKHDKIDKIDKKAAAQAPVQATDVATQPSKDETPPAKADTVHISIQTSPPRKAQVRWGRKSLGMIPTPRALVLERPRDSGPLDLIIYASGFLPVHTRAYTFSDQHVAVKLTPPSEKNKLFGYRQEPAPTPDAGAPAAEPVNP
jgi:hypothetical protein